MGWRVRFDTWLASPIMPAPPMSAATIGSAPERRQSGRVAEVFAPRTPPPSPDWRISSLSDQLDLNLKRRSSDASASRASKRLRELAARSSRESSLLVMPRMEERLARSPVDSNKWRSYRRSLKPIIELPTVAETEPAERPAELVRGLATSQKPLIEMDSYEPPPQDTDFTLPPVPVEWLKPAPEGTRIDLPKLLEPNESFQMMLDSQVQLTAMPPRLRLLSDDQQQLDATTFRAISGKRRRSSFSDDSKEERKEVAPAKADVSFQRPDTAIPATGPGAGTERRARASVDQQHKKTSFDEQRRTSVDQRRRSSIDSQQRRTSIGGPTLSTTEDSAPLLWKTSRGPMAREPPRRRSSLPTPTLAEEVPGASPSHATEPRYRPKPVPRAAPAKVLYAAPLERSTERAKRESMDSAADEAMQQPLKEPSAPGQTLPRIPPSTDVTGLKDYPTATSYRPEPFVRGRKHRRRSGDSAISDASGAMDPEEAEEKELHLLELNPERDVGVDRLQERHLIKRGRRAYRRLMSGETKSMQDVYKMMLDLAWRHRDDAIPPPLPPPPPPESSRPPPRVQLLRPKVRKLPMRPAKPIEALPSDETFYAAAAERAMSNSRRASAERGTSTWGRADVRRGSYPRPTVDLRPSVLLDPASWAPPDAGRRLSDPRAPPPPGRVPRGWINIMEIGAPT